MADSLQNNVAFQLRGVLTTSDTSVAISSDLNNVNSSGVAVACSFTNAAILLQSPDGSTFERCIGTASAGTLTLSQRGITLAQTLTTDAALKREFRPGSTGFVVAIASQLPDAANATTISGAWTFSKSLQVPSFADETARDAAIPTPANGMVCYVAAFGQLMQYVSGNWLSVANGTDYASTRTATPAVANNGEWFRDTSNSYALTYKSDAGVSYAVMVDATGKLATTMYDFSADSTGSETTKPVNSAFVKANTPGIFSSAVAGEALTANDLVCTLPDGKCYKVTPAATLLSSSISGLSPVKSCTFSSDAYIATVGRTGNTLNMYIGSINHAAGTITYGSVVQVTTNNNDGNFFIGDSGITSPNPVVCVSY